METTTWTYEKLSDLISAQIEESLSLEYKASSALDRDKSPQHEITKDVSAFANSAGGVLVYGIREHRDKAQRHLPEAIDPIERKKAPKEWLEHIIQNIRPRIDGIIIRPISIPDAPEMVVYVVEIPQSGTAHQALDCKYYRRFNFEAVPMVDYEIRDVMARQQHPVVDISLSLLFRKESPDRIMGNMPFGPGRTMKPKDEAFLCAVAKNSGKRIASHVSAHLFIPQGLLHG